MIKMKIRVAKEILTRRSFNQKFSLRVFLIPRNLEKPHTSVLELLSVIPRKADLILSVKLTFLFEKSKMQDVCLKG